MIVLINSSKTMVADPDLAITQWPALIDRARQLDAILKAMAVADLQSLMHLSPKLAATTRALIQRWTAHPGEQTLAIDAFRGDIYRGLKAQSLTEDERIYANNILRTLSGLYGIIRPFDGISPYRLELMYSLSGQDFKNFYEFWGRSVAETLPASGLIVNAASEEYFRLIRSFVNPDRVVEPQFLTRANPDSEPTFVVVHAKVARGAFARWLITSRIVEPAQFHGFDDLDYHFDARTSTGMRPVFIKRLA